MAGKSKASKAGGAGEVQVSKSPAEFFAGTFLDDRCFYKNFFDTYLL